MCKNMGMYDDENYSLIKVTADAINNASNIENKENSVLLKVPFYANVAFIEENFNTIKCEIDNTIEDIKSVELDTATVDVIYSMQEVLKNTLAILKDKITM